MTNRLFLLSFLILAAALPLHANADAANYTTPGGYYFTVPANVFSVTATVVGAGGGGGGAAYFNNGGVMTWADAWAGPSGGYQTQAVAVTPGQQVYVEVGTGGCGGHYYYLGTDGSTTGCPYTTWDGTGGGRSVFGSVISTGGGPGYSGYNNFYRGYQPWPTPGSPSGTNFGPGGGCYGGQTPTGYGYGGNGGCNGMTATGKNATNGAVLLSWTAATIPTVISPTAAGIGTTYATLGANVTSTGGAPLTARGTCWGTTTNPTTNCLSLSSLNTGVFSHSRSGLPPGTVIYYRGYATNAVGTGYSPTASFTTVATSYSLSVSKAGTGTGTVTSSPVGIDCGSDCSQVYTQNTSVTLTASPAVGSTFTSWSGACTGTATTCTVAMTAALSVTATFTASAPTASCSVSPSSITMGDSATWTAAPSGGNGTYTYSWSGTDSLTGTTQSVNKTYSTTGTKTASVTVTSNGISVTAACGNSLSVGGIPNLTAGATTPTPSSPQPNQSVSFSASVTNSGSATASNFPNIFQIADAGITTTLGRVNTGTVTSLASGISTPISGSYTFTSAGTYNVRTCGNMNTSGATVISESNTGDNCGAWLPLTVASLTPTASLTAPPSTVDSGQSSTLTWSSTNATSCTGTGFSTGGATNNSTGVSTGALSSNPSLYSITCTGTGGNATDNVSIAVEQPTASISANPERVNTGGSSLISWSASQVTSCSVSGPGFATSTALIGSQTVTNITSPSTYTITCQTNSTPVTDSVTVNVGPDFTEF